MCTYFARLLSSLYIIGYIILSVHLVLIPREQYHVRYYGYPSFFLSHFLVLSSNYFFVTGVVIGWVLVMTIYHGL